MKTTTGSPSIQPRYNQGAFTLTELLVVLAMIGVLALVLTPALAATKPNSKVAQCLNGKRQLTIAWQMYAADNADSLISYSAWITGTMDWTSSSANTNVANLTNSAYALIASYNKSAAVFKCPADYYQSTAQMAANMGPRVRSVSLNGALTGSGGSGPTVKGSGPNGGTFFGFGGAGGCTKMSFLSRPGPSATFVILDEHPDSIDDGIFMFDPGSSLSSEYWRNLPASYHNGAAGISFADGHSEVHKWTEVGGSTPSAQIRKTVYPVIFANGTGRWGTSITFSSSADYSWVNAHMPYR